MSAHFADRAGFLAALAKDDPERVLAEQHADTCPPCRDAFEEGMGLVALLDQSQPSSPLSSDLLARASAAIERQRADPGRATRRIVWGSALGVLVAWAFQLTVGSGFSADLEHAGVSLLVLGIAITGATILRRGARVTVLIMVGVSLAMALLAGTADGLAPGIGMRCAFRELWAAALTWVVAVAVARREDATLGRWDITAVVASGALAAHAGQHLACEVPHSHAHLLVFHFGAVLLAIIVAALSAGRNVRNVAAPAPR
jgi:hypothetical protein